MIPFFRKEPTDLDKAIASVFSDMEVLSADDPEFVKMVDQQVKLHSLKPQGLDPNKLIGLGSSLAITVLVLRFERSGGLVATKLWSFLPKA